MGFLRRLLLLAALGAGSAVLAAPALAGTRPTLPFTLGSTHFLVHYDSDATNPQAITQTTAGDIAAIAEYAYTAELADGFAPPLPDAGAGGDDRIDLYVASAGGALAYTDSDDTAASPTDAFIVLDAVAGGTDLQTIAHELFHAIQFAVWLPQNTSESWFLEATAEWMGYRVSGYPDGVDAGPPDMSLDCRDPNLTSQCDLSDDYRNNGYSRWPFFEYVIEKYGTSIIRDTLAQGQAGNTAVQAVANALAARGASLAATYNAWQAADLVGDYSAGDLQGRTPVIAGTWKTGVDTGALGTTSFALNHLSSRIVEFTRGDDDPSHICYEATLSIAVVFPAGASSQPVFWWNEKGSSPVNLTIVGNTATGSIPWDTCTYDSSKGYLLVTNGSSTLDAAVFSVTASMSVDTTKSTTPDTPPDKVFMPTPDVAASSLEIAPSLTLFGPTILHLSSADTRIRVIVESSGEGALQGKLGTVSLGTVAIRGGNNDVRFKLTKSLLTALRRSAATGSNVLTLTPTSASGAVTGAAVTRTVHIAVAKKPKPKLHKK
jgi:hypothetical protein